MPLVEKKFGQKIQEGEFGFVRVEIGDEDSKELGQKHPIVFIARSQLRYPNALTGEAQRAVTTWWGGTYRDAGFLNLTRSEILVWGRPEKAMNAPVSFDTSPDTLNAERENTAQLLQKIVGRRRSVKHRI